METLDGVGEAHEYLDKEALAKVVGTDHYHAAVINAPHRAVEPGGHVPRSRRDHARQRGGVRGDPGCFASIPGHPFGSTARTARSTRRMYSSPTTRSSPSSAFSLGGFSRWLVAAACRGRSTTTNRAPWAARATGELPGPEPCVARSSNRILARHGAYYTGDFRLSVGQRRELVESHKKGIAKRFPMLDKLDFEHTWGGVFCMTRDWASHFGRIEPGVFTSLGYCGVGLPAGHRIGQAARPRVRPGFRVGPDRGCSGAFRSQNPCRPSHFSVSVSAPGWLGTTGLARIFHEAA